MLGWKTSKGNRLNSVLATLSGKWDEGDGVDWLDNQLIRKNVEFGFRIHEEKKRLIR